MERIQYEWKGGIRFFLVISMSIWVLECTTHAQGIAGGHLNVGATSAGAGSQLTFANGSLFDLTAGYVPMSLTSTGTYPGYYSGGPTLTVLAQTPAFSGPVPGAPSLGSFIRVQMSLESGPTGGAFAMWESGATSPTFSLDAIGSVSGLWALSGGAENPTAGSVGADPYGHIHGRRFTATTPGDYVIAFQAFDTSLNGAQHAASPILEMRFSAVPEPGITVLLACGCILAAMRRLAGRRRTSARAT